MIKAPYRTAYGSWFPLGDGMTPDQTRRRRLPAPPKQRHLPLIQTQQQKDNPVTTPHLIVSAGGTGGGIYPALAVVSAIRKLAPQMAITYVGSEQGLEHDLIGPSGVIFEGYERIKAGPLHGVRPDRLLVNLARIVVGVGQSWRIIGRRKPQAVFITGGWVTVPMAVAAFLRRVPIITYVPDIEPGLTLKLVGRLARRITATVADTRQFYGRGASLVATGYPLREDVLKATRQDGRAHFGLPPEPSVLLVFGGSRGARSLNRALLAIAEAILGEFDLHIIHVTGSTDWAECQALYASLPEALKPRYHLYEYLHQMGLAMAAADLVLSRAGASTLGEFPYFELPAILVPYPYAWRYQKVNADWLADREAAIVLADDRLADELWPLLRDLLRDPTRLATLRAASQTLQTPDGADRIARVILEEIKS